MPRYAPSALGHIPEHLGVERASAGTAWVVLSRLGLAAGSRLLVLGGSGGVGLFLLQLAAAAGVVTIGVGRRAMHDQMIGLGAAAYIDYVREDAARRTLTLVGGPVDAMADLTGGTLAAALPALRPVISHVLPLAAAAKAHRIPEGRHAGGKIVLDVTGS